MPSTLSLQLRKNLELPFVKDELLEYESLEGKIELQSFYLKSVIQYTEIMAKTQLQRSARAAADYEKLMEVFPQAGAEIKAKMLEIRKATVEMWVETKEVARMW